MSGTGHLANRIIQNILMARTDKLEQERRSLIQNEQIAATHHHLIWDLKAWAILDELLREHSYGGNIAVAGGYWTGHTNMPYTHEASAIGLVIMALEKYINERNLTAYFPTRNALIAITGAAGARSMSDADAYTRKRFLEILGHIA